MQLKLIILVIIADECGLIIKGIHSILGINFDYN